MKRRFLARWRDGLALLACAAGLFWSVQSIRGAPTQLRRLGQKARDIAELLKVQAARERDQALLARFNQLEPARPASLADLCQSAAGGAAVDQRIRETRVVAGGWMLRRVDLTFPQLAFDRLDALLAQAESGRPPWRLAECQVNAIDRAPGYARINLLLEALEKATERP
jgi:hypothetical protein